jgi:DmsE family decaheme c-type cytochrome
MVYLGDPEICFSCHLEKRAQQMLPSHHPIKEKKMKCGSCHENHGSENNNLKEETLNDVCANCHAEYEGPFAFEHAPVVEDCSICHEPHGTIANNLLKQNQPFLCVRCHRGHKSTETFSTHPALLTSCTQCHSKVHGSDLPSQMNGDGLTR